MEQQWNETRNQLEEVQAELRTARSQLAKSAGDLTYSRATVGKLETELAVVKKHLEATLKPATPAPSQSEAVCSKALAVSISQMRLGAAPPLAAFAMPWPTVAQRYQLRREYFKSLSRSRPEPPL